jgi:hypothetical protein
MRKTQTILFIIACVIGLLAQDPKPTKTPEAPKLSDSQKLEIQNARVKLFQAKEVLEQTPQFKAFQAAQSNLNETALRIQRDSKVDPAKWTLQDNLEYAAIPEKK